MLLSGTLRIFDFPQQVAELRLEAKKVGYADNAINQATKNMSLSAAITNLAQLIVQIETEFAVWSICATLLSA